MVIEWMRVRVRPEARDGFVETDGEVWTPGLAREAGFLGKEVWLGEAEDEVVLVIRWRSEEEWKAIPDERLKELARRFDVLFDESYEVVETRTFRPVQTLRAGVADRSLPGS
jgi:uncharacterized protein (TIGR03792 family)